MQMPKMWRSKTSKRVCEKTGLNDPRAAVRFLASQILGNETAIPTDLKSIAKRLNVESVVEEPLPFDGMLLREKGCLSIKLNSHSHPLRRRFTLAHELGHILLASGTDYDGKWQRHGCKGREAERLCDVAASELLMPEKEARDYFTNIEVSPQKVSNFASRFEVSLQAAAARIGDLKLTQATFSLLKKKSEKDHYFSRLWPTGKLKLDSSLFLPSLQECFTEKRQFRGRVFLYSLRREVRLEAIRLGSSDFVLVSLNQ